MLNDNKCFVNANKICNKKNYKKDMYIKSLRKAGASETHPYPIIDRWQFRKYRLMFCFTKPYNHNITCLATNRCHITV